MKDYINITLKYMSKFYFEVRDTYDINYNHDDYYSNGDYNGNRLFGIDWVETKGYPQVNANKRYTLEKYESQAYDKYRIEMPNRYKLSKRDDVIIHECVHFLQKNTDEDDTNYISFSGNNYLQYISQRSEYEAHIIQIAYILENQQSYFDSMIEQKEQNNIIKKLSRIRTSNNKNNGIAFIENCKNMKLI